MAHTVRISPGSKLVFAETLHVPNRVIARLCVGPAPPACAPRIQIEQESVTRAGCERSFLMYLPVSREAAHVDPRPALRPVGT